MTFLVVENLRTDRKMHDLSLFPTLSHRQGEITLLAYLAMEYDMSKLSTYSHIKVHPIHMRDTSMFEHMTELGKKSNYVILKVQQNFSKVMLYVSPVSKNTFNGTMEVILKNDVDGQEYALKFPGRSSDIDLQVLTDKMDTVFAYLIKDYMDYFMHIHRNSEGPCKLKAVKNKSTISHFPKELIKVECVAKPIITLPAAAGARPEVTGSEKKNFFTRLFS